MKYFKSKKKKKEMAVLTSFLCCCLVLAAFALGASDNELRIHDASEFIAFSKNSSSYTGTTVYLESDLDFSNGLSDQFAPKSSFDGTFDGQGHTISNLVVKSSLTHVGLFEETSKTIKNVVLDSSCSVACSFTGNDNLHIGGVIGYHFPNGKNLISSIVNMANVTFEGSTKGNLGILYLGGIVGDISAMISDSFVINCVNYGMISHSDEASGTAYVGGIVGDSSGDFTPVFINIQNCFNYGLIEATGSTNNMYVGGIVGKSDYTTINNCINVGTVFSNSVTKGSIAGNAKSNTTITHCLWTSDVGCEGVNGTGTPEITESSLISINVTIASGLNEYASKNGWNKWLLNENSKALTLKANNSANGYSISSQLILLPGSDIWWTEQTGWFTDEAYETLFTASEITEDTMLYGRWDKYTVTFDPNGGENVSFTSKVITYKGVYGDLPIIPARTGYSFVGWFSESNGGGEKVETDSRITSDHTLYAQWVANEYTVTFDANGGDDLEDPCKVIAFNNTYGTLPTPTRTGHTFVGWFNEGNVIITSETIVTSPMNHTLIAQWRTNEYIITFDFANGTKTERVFHFNETIIYPDNLVRDGYLFVEWDPRPDVMPPNNLTITAQWKKITNQVEIIFGTKDLTEEKAKEIIKHYTDEPFTIVEFEAAEDGVRVIVKFTDTEKAENFIERASTSSEMARSLIKRIGFISEYVVSSSSFLRPIVFCVQMML